MFPVWLLRWATTQSDALGLCGLWTSSLTIAMSCSRSDSARLSLPELCLRLMAVPVLAVIVLMATVMTVKPTIIWLVTTRRGNSALCCCPSHKART